MVEFFLKSKIPKEKKGGCADVLQKKRMKRQKIRRFIGIIMICMKSLRSVFDILRNPEPKEKSYGDRF